MRYVASAIVASQLLQQDPAERERRAAEEWRQIHRRQDAEPDAVTTIRAPKRGSGFRRVLSGLFPRRADRTPAA